MRKGSLSDKQTDIQKVWPLFIKQIHCLFFVLEMFYHVQKELASYLRWFLKLFFQLPDKSFRKFEEGE